MGFQFIQDSKGKALGLFIPIDEWLLLKIKYPELEKEEISVNNINVTSLEEKAYREGSDTFDKDYSLDKDSSFENDCPYEAIGDNKNLYECWIKGYIDAHKNSEKIPGPKYKRELKCWDDPFYQPFWNNSKDSDLNF